MILPVLLIAGLATLPGIQEHGQPRDPGKERIFETVAIERDSYAVFMDLYAATGEAPADGREPMLVLFHDSLGSRGEFRPIAPRLTAAGYTCLAVDLGLGRLSRGVRNRTSYTALARGHNPDSVNSLADLEAALLWAREHHPLGPVVALGEGYSAGLALVTAALRPDLVDGALAFSPLECFETAGKSATWVTDSLAECLAPVFFTGAASEAEVLRAFQAAVPGEKKALYVPEDGGVSGVEALWDESPGHEACREAVLGFLRAHFPVPPPGEPSEPR